MTLGCTAAGGGGARWRENPPTVEAERGKQWNLPDIFGSASMQQNSLFGSSYNEFALSTKSSRFNDATDTSKEDEISGSGD